MRPQMPQTAGTQSLGKKLPNLRLSKPELYPATIRPSHAPCPADHPNQTTDIVKPETEKALEGVAYSLTMDSDLKIHIPKTRRERQLFQAFIKKTQNLSREISTIIAKEKE